MTSVSSTTSLLSSSTSTTSTTSSGATSSTSDIDWDGLIEEAVAAKLVRADTIDLKITDNETTIAAYNDASALLSTLLDAAQALRAPSGTTSSSDNVFLSRAAYLTANGDVDASSTLSATIEDGATTGSYDLTVSQLAKTNKIASTTFSSRSEDLGYAGTMSLGVVDSGSAEIEITADMSLTDIAGEINALSGTTGVQASIVKVSDTSYELILSTVETGETIAASTVSGDDILNQLGITDAAGDFANVLQEAQDAIFTLDGITITRSTNDVDDVLDGVTLHLYQTTAAGTSITVEVGENLSDIKTAIVALVDAYNAYRDWAYAQQQLPSTENADTTVLFGDPTIRNIGTAIASALNTTIDSNALSLLGLSFDNTNRLELDEDALDDALLSNLDAIEALLSFQMESSSSDLLLLARGTTVPDDFTLDIVTDGTGSITSVSVDGDSSLFTVSGTRIIGKSGTAYEGYTFVYAGSSSKSVDLGFSTGIAELLYNVADAATNSEDGTLTRLVSDLGETNDALQTSSDDIRERAETYRASLTARYAAYQAAITQAEAVQDYLTTLIDTWNSSS